jgi:hypothetical protein
MSFTSDDLMKNLLEEMANISRMLGDGRHIDN